MNEAESTYKYLVVQQQNLMVGCALQQKSANHAFYIKVIKGCRNPAVDNISISPALLHADHVAMALNSKFEGSIFSAKNENNLALLHGNVDFALIKVEVPKQFEGLGKALSKFRLENAEHGPQHRTARRLGALFEQVIPNIDSLASAYGERASEIATSPELELKATEYGPFAGHVGVDGTSIYAAASSGNSVIALHLLACMLARIFSSAEATAIWTQLVKDRLEEIKTKSDASQLQGIAAVYAAELGSQVLRDDLAVWDASARAWLQAANQVKKREDTQLRLIIRNIPSIQSTGTTYSNVVENWIVAMTTIQKLIQGVPQDISNSSVLLGLMSWHIYPDLNVFSPNKYIAFNDPLVKKGGIITLGLEKKGGDRTGVNWSVSLSHLRYYGDPIIIEKSSEEDSGRITAQELRFITFGCVLGSWDKPASIDIAEAAKCFDALGDAINLQDITEMSYGHSLSWISLLVNTARTFLSSNDDDRETALHYIEFGRRRGRNFLDPKFQNIIPMFGLTCPYLLFELSTEFGASSKDPEASIAMLRQLAKTCSFHRDDCIILSSPQSPLNCNPSKGFHRSWELVSAIPAPMLTNKRSQDGELRVADRHTRWVHVDSTRDPLAQRYIDVAKALHLTKIPDDLDRTIRESSFFNTEEADSVAKTSISTFRSCDCRKREATCNNNCPCRKRGFKCTSMCACLSDFTGLKENLRCINTRSCESVSEVVDEDVFWLSVRNTVDLHHDISLTKTGNGFIWHDPPTAYVERYWSGSFIPPPFGDFLGSDNGSCRGSDDIFLPGDSDLPFLTTDDEFPSASSDWSNALEDEPDHPNNSSYSVNAVGRRVNFHSVQVNGCTGLFLTNNATVNVPRLSLSKLTETLKSGALDPVLLRAKLEAAERFGILDFSSSLEGDLCYSDLFFKSLKAVSAISQLYDAWPEATISMSITKQPLGSARWADNVWNHSALDGNAKVWRSTKFSCLAMLESGGHDIHPDRLELVMAMATGNSIYASEALLQDPILPDSSGLPEFKGILRLTGNIGHAGIVMLIPPPTPRVLQRDVTWERVEKINIFEGLLKPFFTQTSLHLKLTEFKFPLASSRGAVDADVVIREALISVYDGSKWIADLDILQAFENPILTRMPGCSCPRQVDDKDLGQLLVERFGRQLKAITTWDGLLLYKENLMEGEIGTVCVHGNWFARLAVAALAAWMGSQTVALPSHCVCSQCGKQLLEQADGVSLLTTSAAPGLLIL
ncbi:hypothetical protein K449DRAFT_10973 [Hypoxylon sp. EC38]|nr:hypothetical protein K449DRAFT_10973 [Hypoxylon sp. EC38]